MIMQPIKALSKTFMELLKKWKEAINKIVEMMKMFKKVVKSLVTFLELGVSWLNNVVNLCSHEVGTPFQRCTFAFEDINDDCKALVGPTFSYVCLVTDLVSNVCYIVKPIDYICELISFATGVLVKTVSKKFKLLMSQISTMLYIEVIFHRDQKINTTSDQNLKNSIEMASKRLVERASYIKDLFKKFCTIIQLWSIVFLIANVMIYEHKFTRYESFDNIFISKRLINIDMRRAKCKFSTIFPLSYHERQKYCSLTSLKLSKSERKQLIKAVAHTFFTAIKMCSILVADYVIFTVLIWLRKLTKDLTDTSKLLFLKFKNMHE
uniref:Dendritic cell-specific transmembrane protein-like domain-containing protein n=1 Tax=Clastoptera arizonana TaxID=38151 RepID=A0A1B6CIB7_9HEMI